MRKKKSYTNTTFNQLVRLPLKVPQTTFLRAMNLIAQALGTRFQDDMIPLPPLPPTARKDPSYPKALRVLYRKFHCGMIDDGADGNCVSFDVIPLGVVGDPRRFRSYRSFTGAMEDSPELFRQMIVFLQQYVKVVRRYPR